MHGDISIRVHNARVCYEFTLHRNITVLCDQGATGKTSLCRMISDYIPGGGTGIFVNVSNGVPIGELDYVRWRDLTNNNRDIKQRRVPQIFIVDESMPFLTSGDFADFVWSSGCYFVLILRDDLSQLSSLSCSIKEIYRLQTENRKTTFVPLYPATVYGTLPDKLQFITEDRKFGKKFFERVYGGNQVKSASGKDNIVKTLCTSGFKHPVVIADGAAFGFNMREVLEIVNDMQGRLIVEESFEYMLLTSGIFSRYKHQLEEGMQHIDCSEYITWGRFFTAFIEKITADTPLVYKKNEFNNRYLDSVHKHRILQRYGLPNPGNSEETHLFT